jgi:hypothetical protein
MHPDIMATVLENPQSFSTVHSCRETCEPLHITPDAAPTDRPAIAIAVATFRGRVGGRCCRPPHAFIFLAS